MSDESAANEFQRIGEETVWEGRIIRVGVERFRYADGSEVQRDKVWHPGAVGILAVDDTHVWLVRQPREIIGESATLEVPAGKCDVHGEDPLRTAQRELAEEIGMQADSWTKLLDFWPSAGFSDERIHLYLATGLSQAPEVAHAEEDERIEIVRWPLTELDAAVEQSHDGKTLIALLWLARRQDR